MHLRIGTLVSKVEAITRNYNNFKEPNFGVFLKRNFNKTDIERLIEYYSSCNCCENHNVNKPNKLEPWVEHQYNFRDPKPCKCFCRHINRQFCRFFVNN